MSQRVVIGPLDTTFSATCDACGTTFAARLDEDLDTGVFLCRSGHPIRIEREEPPAQPAAVTAA